MKNLNHMLIGCVAILSAACSDSYSVRMEEIRLDEASPQKNGYVALLPETECTASYLLLLPGFGETPQGVLNASTLPHKVAESGTAVFIPTLQDGAESYSFSSESMETLGLIVRDIRQRYGLHGQPYCIGGFSMGGSAAVRFAETAGKDRPECVFAIDSPLDYRRYVYSTERDVTVYRKGLSDGDSTYVKLLEDITPIVDDSPFLLSDTTHAAILPLKDIPIRYYIEPAEGWWLENRQTDVLGLNILDGTAFINDLRLIGNDEAELIITSEKGYRNGGKTYHPHSWTIVDSEDLILWMKQNFSK